MIMVAVLVAGVGGGAADALVEEAEEVVVVIRAPGGGRAVGAGLARAAGRMAGDGVVCRGPAEQYQVRSPSLASVRRAAWLAGQDRARHDRARRAMSHASAPAMNVVGDDADPGALREAAVLHGPA